jgi:GMP synthase PP-ATPase subunit
MKYEHLVQNWEYPKNSFGGTPFPDLDWVSGFLVISPQNKSTSCNKLMQSSSKKYEKRGWYRQIGQAFAALDPTKAVGVMGDQRVYGQIVILRAVESSDFMTADWFPFDAKFLKNVSTRIVNELDCVSRVLFDVTSKPPGTIEML